MRNRTKRERGSRPLSTYSKAYQQKLLRDFFKSGVVSHKEIRSLTTGGSIYHSDERNQYHTRSAIEMEVEFKKQYKGGGARERQKFFKYLKEISTEQGRERYAQKVMRSRYKTFKSALTSEERKIVEKRRKQLGDKDFYDFFKTTYYRGDIEYYATVVESYQETGTHISFRLFDEWLASR